MTPIAVFASVTHSMIDGVVHASVETDLWVACSTIASGAVAILTGWLAWSTRNLSNETKELAKQTFRASGYEAMREQRAARPVVVASLEALPQATNYLYHVVLRNKGATAFNVTVSGRDGNGNPCSPADHLFSSHRP
jgi:hypothetical protein